MESTRRFSLMLLLAVLFGVAGFATVGESATASVAAPNSAVIVQASSAAVAAAAVEQAGGQVARQLPIINSVSAVASAATLARIQAQPGLVIYGNAAVQASGKGDETDTNGYALYPAAATGVHELHKLKMRGLKSECKDQRVLVSSKLEERQLRGWGVTIAVIDSGLMPMNKASDWKYRLADGTLISENSGRCLVYRDFLPRTAPNGNNGTAGNNSIDQNGHGTHVAATIGDNREVPLAVGMEATPVGVAPQANLLIARALDANGSGSYADVIAAIDWVVTNRTRYNVKVLNLSLYSPVAGPYWTDPLNQAVMRAWQSGIVVVAAAGNSGPEAGTITVPGNVPYVITVGGVRSGRYNPSGFDELANYSSRGPTESAFVKPDLVVPASRTIAPLPRGSTLEAQVPSEGMVAVAKVEFKIGSFKEEQEYAQLSGTSMAAAQVSGLVALMIQANPTLTNDEIKFRLLATARPAIDEATGQPVYSVWEQGAGLAHAREAVLGAVSGRANEGMDVALDLIGTTHYWGHTTWDQATGEFRLTDPATGQPVSVWSGAGKIWSGAGKIWSGAGKIWSGAGKIWSGAGKIWSGADVWTSSTSLWAGTGRAWAGVAPHYGTGAGSHAGLAPNE